MNLLVLGPQGAGKGTQAKRIAADYQVPHIATGDRFRAEIAAGTDFGKRVKSILDSGELVPDELTIAKLREWLRAEGSGGFVLDGFPRTLAQAQALDDLLKALGKELDAIFFFNLTDDVATERMLKRSAEEHRPDDEPDVIAKRLRTYHEQTEPIVEHYRATGKLVPLHADRTIDEVYDEVQEALERVGAPA